ncbi:hypothetical protein SAMN05414139_05427 [Burkholderia sp. D7]|nr:hypothetical protein SAMN05414139_05427 [Burkholderia sp. D7]
MTKDIDTQAEFSAGGWEHLQRQKTMRAIFNRGDGEWLTAELINTLQPSPPVNKSHPANDWKRGGLVFSVAHDGEEYFPGYQFDAMYRPKPVISDILKALRPMTDPWKIAAWFHFPNGWISESRSSRDVATPVAPKDALGRTDDVVAAARKMQGTYVA